MKKVKFILDAVALICTVVSLAITIASVQNKTVEIEVFDNT